MQEEREILFVERRQTEALRERIHQVEQFYRQVRELKHEMRGHLTNLKVWPVPASTAVWRGISRKWTPVSVS